MSHDQITDKKIGTITWCDLTVNNAETVKAFYSDVVGWTSEAVSMGDYNDFNMNAPATGTTVSGICHARGSNASLPAQWLMYVNVNDVVESAEICRSMGGKVLDGPRVMCGNDFCVIQDPEGAVLALISDGAKTVSD